jgi:hypothetical protein
MAASTGARILGKAGAGAAFVGWMADTTQLLSDFDSNRFTDKQKKTSMKLGCSDRRRHLLDLQRYSLQLRQ